MLLGFESTGCPLCCWRIAEEVVVAEKISQATRSRMMSGIRGRDTKPELLVRSFLHARGYRFRLCRKDLPGKPDVVLPRWKVAIFAHGCFWHGHHGCRYFRLPQTRAVFWAKKIESNAVRDAYAARELGAMGWRVATIWECALRDEPESALLKLSDFIRSSKSRIEIASSRH